MAVQVYGTLEPRQTIAAERVEVVLQSVGRVRQDGASATAHWDSLLLFVRYRSRHRVGVLGGRLARLRDGPHPADIETLGEKGSEWLDQRWVVVGMGGAAIPDLVKVGIVLIERVVEAFLGVPFTYRLSLHSAESCCSGVVTVAFERDAGDEYSAS